MKLEPEAYVGRALDGLWDPALRQTLSSMSEEERIDFLAEVMQLQEAARLGVGWWLRLAKSVLVERSSFERLLTIGIEVADASTVRAWLEACIPRIGMARALRIIGSELDGKPVRVQMVRYWLGSCAVDEQERQLVEDFNRRDDV